MPYLDITKQKEAQHRSYLKNKEKVLAASRLQVQKKREYIAEVKNKPCMDCGNIFPWYAMDFDHREGEEKLECVGRMVSTGGWDALKKEIKKCDVVCAICHRIRTYQRSQASRSGGMVYTEDLKSSA